MTLRLQIYRDVNKNKRHWLFSKKKQQQQEQQKKLNSSAGFYIG